jgi:adenine-specific DNA methylase
MWRAFSALPNYLGGKRRLIPVIFGEIARVCPPWKWPARTLLDPFMGGGSISLYAKAQGFRVRANDLAYRSYLIGRGIVANNDRRLTDLDVGLLFAQDGDSPHFVEENFVPQCTTQEFARFLDRALYNIRMAALDETTEALLYTVLIRAILLARPGGQMTNRAFSTNMAAGDYDAVPVNQLKSGSAYVYVETTPHRFRKAMNHVNGGIFGGDAQISQEDALAWLPGQQGDLVYLDPPYFGSSSYESNYYPLDCILAGKMLPRTTSRFNQAETALASLIEMLEAADHVPIWIISLADQEDGFNARQICDLVSQFNRRPRIVEHYHRKSL